MKTKKGTEIKLAYVPDCGSNAGGWYVEVYADLPGHDINGDPYDNFCVHKDDCNCENFDEVEKFAEEYAMEMLEY